MAQDPPTIQGEIVKVLMDLNRPATVGELSTACFARNVIDGTRRSVREVVASEVGSLLRENVLAIHSYRVGVGGVNIALLSIEDLLMAMTLAVESSR